MRRRTAIVVLGLMLSLGCSDVRFGSSAPKDAGPRPWPYRRDGSREPVEEQRVDPLRAYGTAYGVWQAEHSDFVGQIGKNPVALSGAYGRMRLALLRMKEYLAPLQAEEFQEDILSVYASIYNDTRTGNSSRAVTYAAQAVARKVRARFHPDSVTLVAPDAEPVALEPVTAPEGITVEISAAERPWAAWQAAHQRFTQALGSPPQALQILYGQIEEALQYLDAKLVDEDRVRLRIYVDEYARLRDRALKGEKGGDLRRSLDIIRTEIEQGFPLLRDQEG